MGKHRPKFESDEEARAWIHTAARVTAALMAGQELPDEDQERDEAIEGFAQDGEAAADYLLRAYQERGGR